MKITVAGAGISGLSTAYRLAELASERNMKLELSIVERSGSPGGVISTQRHDDLIIEDGPDSVLTKNPSVIRLAEKLGLTGEIIPTRDENRQVYILLNGKLEQLPEGFYMMAPTNIVSFLKSPLFSLKGKARISMETIIPPRRDDSDESLHSFVTRRFGKEALERVVQPLLSGIYTADPKKLSLKAVMPQFIDMEKKYGSVIRGLRKSMAENNYTSRKQSGARYSMFVSFREGMRTLVDALVSSLPEGSLVSGKVIEEIKREEKGWKVHFGDGSEETTDGVVLAVPSYVSADALKNVDPVLSEYLGEIEYLSSSVVNLVFRKNDIDRLPRAFGVLVPAIEGRDVIAFSFLSEKLVNRADEDTVIIRCFMGGDLNRSMNELDDRELVFRCLAEVEDIFGTRNDPLYKSCKRYQNALPLYGIGHLERVQRIKERVNELKGFSVAGNAFGGIGIPDCITTGMNAAEKVFQDIFGSEKGQE